MFDDDYVELNDYIKQIDEAKDKKKNKKFTEDELDTAQEFADEMELTIE